MKKKLTALLCTAALLLSLLAVPASAGNSLFFLSLNDNLAPQSAQTTPIQHGGWVYVPVTAFSSRVTGVNFGIYYDFSESGDNLMFYSLSGKTMTFDLINGTATAVYIQKLLKPMGIKVTRIAHGIPVGADLEYADEVTLSKALEGRTEMN